MANWWHRRIENQIGRSPWATSDELPSGRKHSAKILLHGPLRRRPISNGSFIALGFDGFLLATLSNKNPILTVVLSRQGFFRNNRQRENLVTAG